MDWAALAKQWMQFKDVGDSAKTSTPPPPPPAPPTHGGQQSTQAPNEAGSQGDSAWNSGPSEEQAWTGNTANDWTTDMDMEV